MSESRQLDVRERGAEREPSWGRESGVCRPGRTVAVALLLAALLALSQSNVRGEGATAAQIFSDAASLGRALEARTVDAASLTTVEYFDLEKAASPVRDDLVAALRGLHLSAAGRQVLTIFKSDRLVEITPTDLESSRELLDSSRLERGLTPAAGAKGLSGQAAGHGGRTP